MTARRIKAFALAVAIIPITVCFSPTALADDDCSWSNAYNDAVKPVHKFLSQIQQMPGDNYVDDDNNPLVLKRGIAGYEKLGEILRNLSAKITDPDYKAATDAHAAAVDDYIAHLNDDIARGQAPGEDHATRASGKRLEAASQANLRAAANMCS